jgi:hypothetical protein
LPTWMLKIKNRSCVQQPQMNYDFFQSMCVPHALLHSKQSSSPEIASRLGWVHLLLLLLACAFSAWHHGLMKLICDLWYVFIRRKMSWVIVVIGLSKE